MRMASMEKLKTRAREAIAVGLILSLAVGGLAMFFATRAEAAPTAIIGPVESFTARVVPGTIVPFGTSVRFNAERPALTDPSQLEQLVVETVQASLVVPNEILSITGNYDTDTKIFRATSMTSLGNAAPARTASSGGNDNRGGGNDNDGGGNDNDGGGNDNDGGGNDNDGGGNDNNSSRSSNDNDSNDNK
jgi:hypothetical protein